MIVELVAGSLMIVLATLTLIRVASLFIVPRRVPKRVAEILEMPWDSSDD